MCCAPIYFSMVANRGYSSTNQQWFNHSQNDDQFPVTTCCQSSLPYLAGGKIEHKPTMERTKLNATYYSTL